MAGEKPTGKQMAFLELSGSRHNFDSKAEMVQFFEDFWNSVPDEDKKFWDEMAAMFTFEEI